MDICKQILRQETLHYSCNLLSVLHRRSEHFLHVPDSVKILYISLVNTPASEKNGRKQGFYFYAPSHLIIHAHTRICDSLSLEYFESLSRAVLVYFLISCTWLAISTSILNRQHGWSRGCAPGPEHAPWPWARIPKRTAGSRGPAGRSPSEIRWCSRGRTRCWCSLRNGDRAKHKGENVNRGSNVKRFKLNKLTY